ncbi:hypothetical protein [Methylophaga nitratireducenticrescens]|uniref:Uncharacterized protein n=1 Tax=Methylophaga nitratireducenticrescens TaxID=754476 RepID=I1XN65_METNJ|nr:hypothetical protein [Methylophaga nitratireducenticrescens]AFI85834.1 hypothetical protein Q7A_3061 [Methylophaga nitratireducenticrescens]AUZ85544.1 hypothetical protein CDW43_13660 [Methylophaga nitratireducenticrescens]
MLKRHLLAAGLILFMAMPLQAEVLSIAKPTYDTPNSESGVIRPIQGMTMQQVEKKFGQPVQQYAPKGTPAITRWQYPQFDVYFENQLVIHSVVQHEPE